MREFHSCSLAVDASGIYAEQDSDTVPGATGDLRSGHASVQVQGHAPVPQVVWPEGQRGVHLGMRESFLPGELPDAPVAVLAEQAALCTAEQAPVRASAEAVEVRTDEADQDRSSPLHPATCCD